MIIPQVEIKSYYEINLVSCVSVEETKKQRQGKRSSLMGTKAYIHIHITMQHSLIFRTLLMNCWLLLRLSRLLVPREVLEFLDVT